MNTPTRYAIALMMASCFSSSAAWAIELSDVPLFLTTPLAPNIIVTLDTSGSMEAAHTPDALNSQDATKRYKSSYYNPMYYNPNVRYEAPRKFDGTVATTSFTSAPINGFDVSKGTVNLETNYQATKSYALTNTSQTFAGGTNPFAGTTSVSYSYTCQVDFDNNGPPDRINIGTGRGLHRDLFERHPRDGQQSLDERSQ
jgi:type IV pilus assembly protein PilY1